MSGTKPTPAEQHLGDRLAALVDGELGHDARERVLAHLATCAKCRAEADAQRRLKSVFARAAPPPPSEGLLARLQGLPGGTGREDDDRGGPFGPGRLGDGALPVKTDGFGYARAGGGAGSSVLPGGPDAGFRIHEVGRPGAERPSWRGRRFAFAAASAVSFAAIALGGALPAVSTVDARGEGTGSNATPLRAPGQTPSSADTDRRRGSGSGPAGTGGRSTAAPLPVAARQPGAPFATGAPLGSGPSVLGGTAPTPLIRPTGQALHLATASGAMTAATPSPSVLPLGLRH